MATMEPVANRQSSADSLDEWASEVWGTEEGKMDPILAQDTTPPPHPLVKQAPRAKSEDLGSESPDAPVPRPQVPPSSENLTDSTNKMAEVVPKMEQEALSGVNQVPSSRIQVGDSELEQDLKMLDDNHCEKEEDAVAFRSPLACTDQASPAEGAPETQPYPLEEEEEEEETIDCISDGKVEVISNPVEEEMSSSDSQGSQEWPSRSHLDDVVEEDKEEEDGAKEDKVEESQSVEMMENGAVRLELNTEYPASSELEQGLSETVCATEQASVEGGPVETSSSTPSVQVADKQEVSECPISSDREQTMSDNNNHDTMKAAETSTTTHSPLKRESSVDIFSESPENPESAFAGDGEESQSVDSKPLDISSARRQWVRLDSTRSKSPQPKPSTSSRSSSCSHLVDLAQPPGVVTPDKQQGEQLLRNVTAALTHHSNQEVAAQQVFKGATPAPPLATVAKVPANQVKADLLGSGCVVVKEQAGGEREEGKREGDNRQTGGERGQRASGLGAAGEADRKKKEKRSEEKRTNPGLLMSRDSHSKASKMKLGGDLFDDSQSDSGVSADFSPDSTVELQTTTSTPTLTSPPADETPIEREIRRAVQREQSLRRSRGLHNKPPTQEYVDIPLRKSVLTETLPSKSDKSQGGKDRQFAGKKMQKEISVETQREQVLVQLGKVKGSYDKGTVRQLKERKKLFEAFQEPKGTSSMVLSHSKAPSWASASDLSTLEIQGNDASSVSFVEGSFGERRRSSLELMCQTQNQSPSGTPKGITYIPHGAPVPRGPTLSESTGGQIIILDSHHHLVLPAPAHIHHVSKPLRHSHSTGALTETQGLTVVDSASMYSSTSTLSGEERRGFWRDEDGGRMDQEEEEEEEEVPKENPFFKLRSSSVSQDKVEQDIREAREREKELRRQRSSLYGGGGGGGGGRPASREVQSPTSPPPLLLQNGLVTPELSVTPSSRTASATPTARQSLGKLGMWPPPQTDEYLDSQSEGLQSPRTPRQKTPLLQRWESGQVMNGHGWEEED